VERSDCNEISSIWLLQDGDFDLLLTGDTTSYIEDILIDNHLISKIEVLKVAHHGSQTASSKEFLDIVSPDASVISVGKGNKYSLPSAEALNRLAGSFLFRTDEDGAVEITVYDELFKIKTFSGKTLKVEF